MVEANSQVRDNWQVADAPKSLLVVDLERRNRILHCMKEAETILRSKEGGEKVYYVLYTDIYAVMLKLYGDGVGPRGLLCMQLQNLYREDLFYADS